ncbi:MAG: CDP-glucose 4,6-dehydratase [Acidimicrobiales bacterium]
MTAAEPFEGCYRGRRVLVTGHTGFKGAWLSAWLLHLGAEVHGLSIGTVSQPSLFEILELERRMDHRLGDIRDPDVVVAALEDVRPDIVFHLAAQPIVRASLAEPLATLATNAMGTAHLLEGLRTLGRPVQAVLITSDKAYRNKEWEWGYRETDELGGRDPYSASKACAELVIRTYHDSYFSGEGSLVNVASTRAGNVIGGGDWAECRVVPDCIRAWSQGKPVEVRNPAATRPWQHVLEPLSGYLALGRALTAGEQVAGHAFNFGPAAEVSAPVIDLIENLGRFWSFGGLEDRVRVLADGDAREAGLLKLNCDKALARLRWRPALDFDQTARLTAGWYETYYRDGPSAMFDFTQGQVEEYVTTARAKGLPWTGHTPSR